MKRAVRSRPALSVTVRRGLALWLGAPWMMFSVTVLAQDDPGDSPPPSADSQAVDEEEAEFRRRMELEERSGDERSSPVDLPDIVEVDPADAPEDPLPPRSREHLEEQLTELIIENGRWEPSDAEREAPFEPSEAAKIDPELAAQEAEAWEEMVAAYHEREQAAWTGGAGSGQEAAAGAGQGGGDGSDAGQGAGQTSGQGSEAGSSESTGSGAGDGGERPPSGDPFSALEFLGGSSSQPAESQDDETRESDDPVSAGQGPEAQTPEAQNPEAQAPEAQTPEAQTPETGEPRSEAPATPMASADPGAVDPSVLEALFAEEMSAADAEAREDSDSGQDEEDAPPGSPPPPGPPPEPSFWDWLFGLFGSEPESTPESEDSSG